jgi:hypothetical protein
MVTENAAHFAAERDLVLVFVLKRKLPAGGGQEVALADLLDRWARDHHEPYLGAPLARLTCSLLRSRWRPRDESIHAASWVSSDDPFLSGQRRVVGRVRCWMPAPRTQVPLTD